MKKIACLCAMMASLAAFAGSAGADGTDFVVTADAGESFTNSTAIGNYARLVKRGAGEVVLTAATTAFAGDVVIETGTLAITDRFAVGTGTPITVQDGATFWLKIPHPGGGQATAVFTGHKMTIAGKGVNGAGAIRYTRTNASGNADNMFSHVELTDDATVEVASRWGMREGNLLDLKGHTLTRVGSGVNWMFYNQLTAGTIMQTDGTMTFQGGPTFRDGADTLVVVTNSGALTLWAISNPIEASIKLYTGRSFTANAGANPKTQNIINGPIHIAKFPGATDASIETRFYDGNNTVMTLNGPITGDTGYAYAEQARLTYKGPGTLYMNGPLQLEGNFTVNAGNLMLTSGATRVCNGLSIKEKGSVLLDDGHLDIRFLRVANGGNTKAVFRQTGGALSVYQNDVPRIGEYNKSMGFFTLENGEVHVSNSVYMAEWTSSFGAFRQTGGLFETRRTGYIFAGKGSGGAGGTALFVQTGGTNDSLVVASNQSGGFLTCQSNGVSEVTVSGTGTLFRTALLQFGYKDSVCTNIFNLSDGAVFKANRFRQSEEIGAGSLVCMNVDGGILMPTYAFGWSAAGASNPLFYPRALQHVVVWKKGLVFDTSENSANSGKGSSTLALKFESPTGKGVESVALPTVSGFIATNYMGIARVVFEDATGWGASAYAEYDHSTKKVSKIVVTSRGCDYSDGTKAYLESPDRTTRYECALTLTSNEGLAGEFVKRGAPTLELFATNTITGGIAVESGTLMTYSDGVIPSNTSVRVESGATLDLIDKGNITVSTFTGAGTVSRGNVTVTNAIRATCADLFANKHATFGRSLTFAEGATFTITDPENLEAYKNEGSVTAFTATSVNGTPTLRIPDDYTGSTKWALFKSGAGSYKFGPVIGTMILLK
ncbi:MAG: autotransporter-associated beta strand repeat-containing protein [Kiritimatiellae bacterium]|nr:autotransporter-associated beta strand repeat-containing protein [Kiritimatiellia bacterium]